MTNLRLALAPLALAACSTAAAGAGGSTGPDRPAAATNTSIATATPLGTARFALPCEGAVYFGPFEFTTEGEQVSIASTAHSLAGGQVCGGGQWLDANGEFVEVAGIGCTQDADQADGTIDYTYTPGAGGPAQNPVYLELFIADPRPATCDETLIVDLARR